MSMERTRSESYSGRNGYGGGGSSYDDPYQMTRRSESYNGPARSYGSTSMQTGGSHYEDPQQLKRYKSAKSKSWDLGMQDPEMKRKKRVASYKVYTVEGKMKSTFRSSLRWIKNKYIDLRYGWW